MHSSLSAVLFQVLYAPIRCLRCFRNIHRHHQMKRLSPFFAVISTALLAPLISNAAQQIALPTAAPGIESVTELAIVDANIADKNLLIRELVRSRPIGQMKVLELTPHADGITQITGHLQSAQQHYKAVHFFAHGEERQIHLGNSTLDDSCLLYTSPSPRDQRGSRMPSSA